jgi:hypothetical protein
VHAISYTQLATKPVERGLETSGAGNCEVPPASCQGALRPREHTDLWRLLALEALHHENASCAQVRLLTVRHAVVEQDAPLVDALRNKPAGGDLLSERTSNENPRQSTEHASPTLMREMAGDDDRRTVPDAGAHRGCLSCGHVCVHNARPTNGSKSKPRLPD